MLTISGLARGAPVLLCGLAMAACTTHRPAPLPAATVGQVTPAPSKGLYKVGTPYQIDGVWYYPAEDFSYDETGIASWYGEQFHGKYTANGETFDLNAVSAAHRTLPMPCIVEVTNLENGRTIQVRVNDRGPFARGRIIDLSRRSAQLLGFEKQGTAKVHVRILVAESIQEAAIARRNGSDRDDKTLLAVDPPSAAPRMAVAAVPLQAPPGVKTEAPRPAASLPRPAPEPPPAQIASVSQLQRTVPVTVKSVKPSQIYIQAGAYSKQDNANRVKSRLAPLGSVAVSGVRTKGIDFYRVRLGPIQSVEEADRLLARIVDSGLPEAQIIVD